MKKIPVNLNQGDVGEELGPNRSVTFGKMEGVGGFSTGRTSRPQKRASHPSGRQL